MISAGRECWFGLLLVAACVAFGFGVRHLPFGQQADASYWVLPSVLAMVGVVLFAFAWRVGTKGLGP